MSIEDKIYKIVPPPGGFEAVWGFDPSVPQKPSAEWIVDELVPYTEDDARRDAVAIALMDAASKNDPA